MRTMCMHFDARTPVLQLNSRLVLSLESTKLDSDYSLAVVVYPPIFAFFALFVSCIVDQELVACKFCIKVSSASAHHYNTSPDVQDVQTLFNPLVCMYSVD